MRNIINLTGNALALFSITCVLKFSSCAAPLVPRLENRTLEISKNIPGLEYPYEVCEKRWLGICTNRRMEIEKYDLTLPSEREKLRNMRFVCRVEETPTN